MEWATQSPVHEFIAQGDDGAQRGREGQEGGAEQGPVRRRKACPIWSVALVDAPSAGGDPAGRLHVLHHQLRCPEDPSCSGWALWPHSRGDLSPWHCFALHRGPPRSSSSDPDFVVVDGVPVMLPSYDEAVSGGFSALGPGYLDCQQTENPGPNNRRNTQNE